VAKLFRPTRLILLVAMVSTVLWAASAPAQCVGETCSLGGQLRQQVGHSPPIPITLEPAISGPIEWGQPGGIQARPGATIMQQDPAPPGTPGSAPRSLMLPPAQLTYDGPPVSVGYVHENIRTLAIQTNLDVVAPHPGTTASGGPASGGPFGSATFAAGGRTGPTVVSWCAGLPPPTASFNPGCSAPDRFGFTTTTTGGP